MKQRMQKGRHRAASLVLWCTLLALLSAVILFVPMAKEKTVQCASFALPSFGEETSDLTEHYDSLTFSPGGMPFGVRFFTRGVLVVGVTDVVGENSMTSPAREAGIEQKDVIIKIDGKEINTAEQVTALVENSGGKPMELVILRNGNEMTVTLTAMPSKPDGIYRAGLWIRDSTAGIGTVTMLDTKSGRFWGLGHGICDVETGELLPLLRANVSGVTISGIEKGKKGAPGELKGYFGNSASGKLWCNTDAGVSGEFADLTIQPPQKALHLARKSEVKEGDAYIYCTLDDNTVRKYEIQIQKIRDKDESGKNFVIKITDPTLIEKTGGIVQGMSGSPIIQNEKIVGAVTHVLVGDPTSGYGIFIENMLNMTQMSTTKES